MSDVIEDKSKGLLRQNVMDKGNLIREIVPAFHRQAGTVLDAETCLRIRRVVMGGSGDSHFAPMCTEMMFEAVAKLPTEANRSMSIGRYTMPFLSERDVASTLAIGVSVGGGTARAVELLSLAYDRGAYTLAMTANPESRITKVAKAVFNTKIARVEGGAPGMFTYVASMIGLYTVALRLAETRKEISQTEGDAWRKAMLRAADIIDETNKKISDKVRKVAEHLKDAPAIVFYGSGPNFGTALYGAAKIVEGDGWHELGQDIEEWAHLQRFTRDRSTVCFVIAPPGLSYSRAVENCREMKRLGHYLVAVVRDGEKEISSLADVVLPVYGDLPEPLTPLVYSNAVELFTSDHSEVTGEPYFRGRRQPWPVPAGQPYPTQGGKIYSTVAELDLPSVLKVD